MSENNETPYIHEEVSSQPWIKSKAGKLTVGIAGGAVLLGGAFGAGVVVGATEGRHIPGIESLDRDGDHKFNGQFPGGDGQHPPRPGDHDGDGPQFDPNRLPAPTPTTQNG